MRHPHLEEICYWAEHPFGTKVWCKTEKEWLRQNCSGWLPVYTYIVDNEWAELRKAQADGKQLQLKLQDKWIDAELVIKNKYNSTPKHWRIKPDKVRKYKWAYSLASGAGFISISDGYYENLQELQEAVGEEIAFLTKIQELYIEEEGTYE